MGEALKIQWNYNYSQKEHMAHLLTDGFESDFVLILGQEKTKVAVHQIFLKAGSPVLYSALKRCGDSSELIIDNVDTRIFKIMLKYLYTGEAEAKMEDGLPLLRLATEYEISGLRNYCAKLLKGELTVENVLPLFQGAMTYAHGELIQDTLNFICRNARKVLKQEEFVNLTLDCLVEIIQQDKLRVMNEIEVFNAVYRWGLAECDRSTFLFEDPTDPKNMKKVLQKPLQHVRFPLMDATEFVLNVATKNILGLEEIVALQGCFLLPPDKRNLLPPGRFGSTPRTYLAGDINITLSRGIVGKKRAVQTSHIKEETIKFVVAENVALNAVKVPKAIFDVGGDSYTHYYDLLLAAVTIKTDNGEDVLLELTDQKLHANCTGEETLLIKLDPPFELAQSVVVALTVGFSGSFGFHARAHGVRSRQNQHIRSFMISNYSNFEDDTTYYVGLQVLPRAEGELAMTAGFIEGLEFHIV